MNKGMCAGEVKRDLVGRQIGCYTVLDKFKRVKTSSGTTIMWKCLCQCGNERYVYRSTLLNGKNMYCDKCRPRGVRNDKLYHIYHGIKQRCYNPNTPRYQHYGGKGIKMCDEWLSSYTKFRDWALSQGYEPDIGLSIDRIDNSGDYRPDNCRWISLSENSGRANIGLQKSRSKLKDVYAISPNGDRIDINNILKFSTEHNLNYSSVNAALRGRSPNVYNGWEFHSNMSR